MTLIGYQHIADWMGTPVLSLADVWPARPHTVIVGLNPAPISVAAGHYYQGKAGRSQLNRLAQVGLFDHPTGDPYVETAALTAGVGMTDIVKRPTNGEDEVTKAEIEHGTPIRAAKLAADGVPLVVCVFRHPVKALFGKDYAPGLVPAPTACGGRVFRMPGPMHRKEQVPQIMEQLTPFIKGR